MSVRGGMSTVPVHPSTPDMHILVTLRRFDHKYCRRSYSGPFIPWERRLPIMEILEIQGHDFRTGSWNREYDRPHVTF